MDLPPGAEAALRSSPDLTAIDIQGPPELRILDLRALPAGLHVTVRGSPQLSTLRLPSDDQGFVVHVDFGEGTPALRVEGAVHRLDACWITDGQLREADPHWTQRCLGRKCVQRAWLGPVDALPSDVELALVHGGRGALDLRGAAARILDLRNTQAQRVTVDDEVSLQVTGAPELEEVSANRFERLRLSNVPALRHVAGHGRRMSVREGAEVNELHVSGRWDFIALTRCAPPRVVAPWTRSFQLDMCHAVHRLQGASGCTLSVRGIVAPLVPGASCVTVTPAPWEEVEAALQGGFPFNAQVLDPWMDRLREPELASRAIGLLQALLAQGQDPEILWDARMNILSAHTREPFWCWSFPEDQADRAWDADVDLWLGCRQDGNRADRFREFLEMAHEPIQVAAIARAWLRDDANDALLAALLHQQLDPPEGLPSPSSAGLRPGERDHVDQIVRVLVQRRTHPRSPGLVAALCRWAAETLPGVDAVAVLGALRRLGAREAVNGLATIMADTERHDAATRQLAFLQLTSPVEHALLAFQGPETSAS